MLNIFMLALEHHDMTAMEKQFQATGSTIFTILFTIEAVVKIMGMGVAGFVQSLAFKNADESFCLCRYLKVPMNTADFLIVLCSLTN